MVTRFGPSKYESALDVTPPRLGMQHHDLQENPEQPKNALQDQYRDRESKLCEQLRVSIANLTNQDPSTRYEIFTEGEFCSFAIE